MHLILCVDDNGGLSFCGRRQSRDSEVFGHILRLAKGSRLWISPYSAPFFTGADVIADEAFQHKAGPGDYCFVENDLRISNCEELESVSLYRWNRTYPSTEKIPESLLEGMALEYTVEFPGRSHQMITMERYVR